MVQRTAFLNSDAQGYNKDFHHTWIHNFLLKQTGVMFTNYTTKPEFALGDGQVAAGKAIIKCTRSVGTFAGKEILVLFESTAVESINTTGDKKVFIEIPQTYIDDSTTITDTLTQGINLGVGIIKSEAAYPSHSNYIPLWEITGGDWAGATDMRQEILRAGKPNTISYFDNTGKEQRLELNSASLNKFLKSNGDGVAPSWADVGSVVEVSNLKKTFVAGETILPQSMFRMEQELATADADETLTLGYDSDDQKRQLNGILNGEDFSEINLNLEAFNTPADDIDVRIETVDASGNATGTLIDVDAYGTVTPTGTLGEVTITLNGTITGNTAGTRVAVVLERSGGLSTSNYFKVGVKTASTGIRFSKAYDGASWTQDVGYKGYISSDGFMDEAAIQSKATNSFLADAYGYSEAGASAGNEFTGIFTGMFDWTGVIGNQILFLSDTGELDTSAGTITKEIAEGVMNDVAILKSGAALSGSSNIYDAVITASDGPDALNDALNAGKRRLLIRPGTYALDTGFVFGVGEGLTLHGDLTGNVRLDLSYYGALDCTSTEKSIFKFDFGSTWDWVTANGAFVEPRMYFDMNNLEIIGLAEYSDSYKPFNLFELANDIGFRSTPNNDVRAKFNIDVRNFKFSLTGRQSVSNGSMTFYLQRSNYAPSDVIVGGGFFNCDFKFSGASTNPVERMSIYGDYIRDDNYTVDLPFLFESCSWAIMSNRESENTGYIFLDLRGGSGPTPIKRNCKVFFNGFDWGGEAIVFDYDYCKISASNFINSVINVTDGQAMVQVRDFKDSVVDNSDYISMVAPGDIPDDIPNWATATSYTVGDIIFSEYGDNIMYCVVNHTSDDYFEDYYTNEYRVEVPYNVKTIGDCIGSRFDLGAGMTYGLFIVDGDGSSTGDTSFSHNSVSGANRFIGLGDRLRVESNHFSFLSGSSSDRKQLFYGDFIKYLNNSLYVYMGGGTLKSLFKGDYYLATSNIFHKGSTSGDLPAIEEIGSPTGGVTANNIFHEGS